MTPCDSEIEAQHKRFAEKGPGQISPFLIPKLMGNAAGAQVALMHGYMGPNYCCVSACASGGHAVATAARMLQLGEADVMVTGGAEATVTMDCLCEAVEIPDDSWTVELSKEALRSVGMESENNALKTVSARFFVPAMWIEK